MSDQEFMWFKQFLSEMIPAMAREFSVRVKPKFNLDGQDQWHLPLGDLRRLDQQLLDDDRTDQYSSLKLEQYM
ncbi:hypothetical protein [Halovivax limisalsi]|uniref:hypothetical protein n=1 Tax=Halovivax limisalsi TaxID=1453760 RepID=UPI001FFD0475|nr:hypothetical protein [Halovivax limisalsi]